MHRQCTFIDMFANKTLYIFKKQLVKFFILSLTELDEGPGRDLDLVEVLPVRPLGPRLPVVPLDGQRRVLSAQFGGLAEEGRHRDGRVVVGVRVHLPDADGAVRQGRREVGRLDDEVGARLDLGLGRHCICFCGCCD